MTSSSANVRSGPADPLAKRPSTTSWKLVVVLLIVIPFAFAFVLSNWLGAPKEALAPEATFAALGLPQVPTESLDSLAYGKMLFVRLKLSGQPRANFLRSLTPFTVSRGQADKPISFHLEREWWSPPEEEEGTLWQRDKTTIWNPDSQPSTFYAVVLISQP